MQTQPVTWGKVRLTDRKSLNCSAARSRWFNDLPAAGEWSHCNILFWLVLRAPWGSGWHDSGWRWCHWSAGQPVILTRSGRLPSCLMWPSQGPVESNSMRQKNYLLRPRGKGCHSQWIWWNAERRRGRTGGLINVTNEVVENKFRKHNSCI